MADTAVKNGMTKWIIGLCLTATLAIVGWTVTGTLASRLRSFEVIKETTINIEARQSATDIRVAVLENKYDTIQASLAEIKALLQKHMEK